ncbi:MAG: FAD binding domain-containing protein [Actinomycetota bacterium]
MKPARFLYADPDSVDEAVSLLAEHGEDARILAGGQSLIPLMNMRLAEPRYLIDINRISQLAGIRPEDGELVIGALARHAALASSAEVGGTVPLVAEAAGLIGHPQIRHRGTAGGSIAEADPAGQLPATLLAVTLPLKARSARGSRRIPASDLFVSFLTTSLAPDEMITELRIPKLSNRTGSAFLEVARRRGDFAMVGVAAVVTLGDAGAIDEARIALAAMDVTPVRAHEAEGVLQSAQPTGEAFREAAERASRAGHAVTDIHATSEYRVSAAKVLVERALQLAVSRAREG